MKVCSRDWFGETRAFAPEMEIQIGESELVFCYRVNKKPLCDTSLQSGSFTSGLWESDVAEFFVRGLGPAYQEINVSPTGAWWSASFSGYRQLDRELSFQPTITSSFDDKSWEVSLNLRLTELLPWRNVARSDWKISVASILYDPEPNYFCWHHNQGGEPDFHRPDLFRPLN